jgi:TRAP-type C4-dicarboxylate transport system substrate-binding protein
MNRRWLLGAVAAAVVGLSLGAQAQTKWDLAAPWGPQEFHTINLNTFATKVREVTGG